MKTERVRWKNWDAVRCVARESEMVVGVLETLSGEVTLAPGEHLTHRARWRLLPPLFAPHDWQAIGAQAGCISATSIARHAP